MTGHRSFEELTKGFSPQRKARVAARVTQLMPICSCTNCATRANVSQQDLARELHVGQPAVAKLERRADMYVSNLRRYVEALEITARFPEGSVNINNFGELGAAPSGREAKSPATRTNRPGANAKF